MGLFDKVRQWRERALTAELQLEQLQERISKQAVLFDIEQRGRTNVFRFVRNGRYITVETYSTMSDDLPGWKRELIDG